MKNVKTWDDYEKELFAKGKITEEEMTIEKLKIVFSSLLHKLMVFGRHNT